MLVELPANIDAFSLGPIFSNIIGENRLPSSSTLILDFSKLNFIEPVGVTALGNLVEWLLHHNVNVSFICENENRSGVVFLDDSMFFHKYLGRTLRENALPRSTTRPLERIESSRGRTWLSNELVLWIASRSGLSVQSLDGLQTALIEVFHNIQNHSSFNIASTFVQHYPNISCLRFSISDFGVGIPYTARRVPELRDVSFHDYQLVLKACEMGFTSRSTAGNAGRGLPTLIDIICVNYQGNVRIISDKGFVQFSGPGKIISTQSNDWIYPGCMIDIKIPLDQIPYIEDNMEEFTW